MRSLTRDEFLEILNLTSGTFDQLQHAGHVALAFGTPLPATPGRYLDLDLVAMATNLGLYAIARSGDFNHDRGRLLPSMGKRCACYAEAHPNQNFFMAVGEVGWDAAKIGWDAAKKGHEHLGSPCGSRMPGSFQESGSRWAGLARRRGLQ